MGFARGATVLQSSSPEHENKLFVAGGGGAPFMASNNSNIMHQQTQHQQVVPDHHQQYHHHDQMSYGMTMMQPITSSSSTLNPVPNFMYVILIYQYPTNYMHVYFTSLVNLFAVDGSFLINLGL